MNIAIINVLAKSKSTGKISYSLYQHLKNKGHNTIICYGRHDEAVSEKDIDCIRINNNLQLIVDTAKAKLLNNEGFNAKGATKNLIKILDKHKANAVYLLNIHDHFINQPMLFEYFRQKQIKCIYLMIDEYPMLGSCAYSNECNKYKIICNACPKERQKTIGSKLFNNPSRIFMIKRKYYHILESQMIFVGIEYVVERAKLSGVMSEKAQYAVIDEAVDLRNTYYPRDARQLRNKLGINEDKIICVLVAPFSNARKGAIFFRDAAKIMEQDHRFVFVHVGYDGKNEDCPTNYIPVSYVSNQDELAEYYSLGDVFVCTSLAKTIPATCLEALSCGTPLIGFDISGTPYCSDEEHGTWVEPKSAKALVQAIMQTQKKTERTINSCREYAKSRFDSAEYNIKLEMLIG